MSEKTQEYRIGDKVVCQYNGMDFYTYVCGINDDGRYGLAYFVKDFTADEFRPYMTKEEAQKLYDEMAELRQSLPVGAHRAYDIGWNTTYGTYEFKVIALTDNGPNPFSRDYNGMTKSQREFVNNF
jgi:hypothetical protein